MMSSITAEAGTPRAPVNPAASPPAARSATLPAAPAHDRVDRAQCAGRNVPLLVAGGLVLGAAVVAAPAALAAGAVLAEGGAALAETGAAVAESGAVAQAGAALGEAAGIAGRAAATFADADAAAGAAAPAARVGAYLATLGRDFAAEYRAAAQRFTGVHYADPKELGRALGAQAWAATEEAGRGAVVAAGLTAGAAAVHGAAGLVTAGAYAVARAAAAVESASDPVRAVGGRP